ncbi:MAG: HNH endonuclease [Candidatus Heimdallarchaeota archaeon]|nr:HNH endonuclease [Candidatus Heimdallarchaeota archaeon]
MSFSETITKEIDIFNKARLRIIERAAKEIIRNFDDIQSRKQYEGFLYPFKRITSSSNKLDKNTYEEIMKRIHFRILELIYSEGRVNDHNWDGREEKLRKLLYLSDSQYFRKPWNKTISASVANIITGNQGGIKTQIETSQDLILLIESWQSVGMSLDWGAIAKKVNIKLKQIDNVEERIEFKNKASPVLAALDKYANLENNIKFPKKAFSKKEVKTRLDARVQRKRVVVDGKHLRDHMMTRMYKKMYDYKCELESDHCDGEIEVNHRIPLKYGVKLGGIDALVNYQLLCSKHHKEIEQPVVNKLDSMPSDYEKLDYLKQVYPEVIKISLTLKH